MKILPGEEWTPIGVDKTRFDPRRVQPIVDRVLRALSYPYIFDRFGNHCSRREWRHYIEITYGLDAVTFITKNSLRINVLTGISLALNLLGNIGSDEAYSNSAKNLESDCARLHSYYDPLTRVQKTRKIKDLKSRAYDLLTYFDS